MKICHIVHFKPWQSNNASITTASEYFITYFKIYFNPINPALIRTGWPTRVSSPKGSHVDALI